MKLRAYRESRGQLEDQAESLGLTPGYLSQLERGLKWPGPFIIRKITEWSRGQVTAQDIFDNLDMSLFATKPIRVGKKSGVGKGSIHPHGDPAHVNKGHTKKASGKKNRR